MTASRLEINFYRLLYQCNKMVSDGKLDDWKLEKYIGSLEEMLTDMKQCPNRPKAEVLTDCTSKVEFLKGIIQADKLPTTADKAFANQIVSPGPTSGAKTITREIHLKTSSKYKTEMRRELLGTPELRRRVTVETGQEDNYDTMLKYHQALQEKVAEEMISFARNLKENTKLAGNIIRKDTEMIDKSSRLAEQNFDRLKVESTRLEKHTNRSCSWWIWIMLAMVCALFLFMVMFMKLFPKSK
ncbi:SNAP receptor use1 [Chamberlinius hualienensis]